MKNYPRLSFFLVLISSLLNRYSIAQTPSWLWAKSGGAYFHSNSAVCVATDNSGNSYAVGSFDGDTMRFGSITLIGSGMENLFLVKYNAGGIPLWAKTAQGNNTDFANSVAIDAFGNCYIVGGYGSDSMTFDSTITLTNANPGHFNMFIAKYDSSGNIIWARNAGGSGYDWAECVKTDATGNSYVVGEFSSSSIMFGSITLVNAGSYDAYFAKYDSSGNVKWAKSYGGSGDDRALSVATNSSGVSYVTGYFSASSITIDTTTLANSNASSSDVFLAKFDSSGTAVWVKSATGLSYDVPSCVSTDTTGNVYVSGSFQSGTIHFGSVTLTNSSSDYDLFVVKYNDIGNVIWAKKAGGANGDFANSVCTDPFGNIYLTGWFKSPMISFGSSTLTNADNSGNSNDLFLVKCNSSGTALWAKGAGGHYDDRGYSVATDVSANCFMTGSFTGNPAMSFDTITLTNVSTVSYWNMFIAKIGTNSVGILSSPDPENNILIYPNPSSGILVVNSQGDNEEISIRNVLGEIVFEEKVISASSTIDLSNQSNGIYFINVKTEKESVTQKIIIQK